jgi:outer membrane usher protein FimD/PapC
VQGAAGASAAERHALEPLLLSASLNGRNSDEVQMFGRDSEGRIYVSEAFLRQSNIRMPAAAAASELDGQKFFLLDAALPIAAKLSEPDQSIALTAPSAFSKGRMPPSPPMSRWR